MVAAGSITVAVRVRPPNAWEAARLPEPVYDQSIRGDGTLSAPGPSKHSSALRDIVQIVDDRILCFDPRDPDASRSFCERGFLPPGTKRYKDKRFMFDKVFNNEASQTDVYEATAKPLLTPLLNGFNATIFAYGATGCGKTHTISGTEADPGIIYLTMADLFQRIEDRRDDYNVEVIVTFLEIYNEEIRDLLADNSDRPAPRGGLQIREDKTVKVAGLVELKPRTAEEVKEIVLQGNLRRTQSPTHANETSSRSHAVLQIHVTQWPRTAALTEERTMGTLSIIDLAGSERAAATTNMGQRMVEGANINKSLLALGNCINALCESGGATRHVPYRNSKLTRLLKFSLGGNCKTVMIVCVAPTSNHFDDTHNTLLYADRATKIKTKVVTRNVVNVDRHVGQYVEAINRLNIEVAELKARLAGKRDAEAEVARRRSVEAKAEVERAKADIMNKANQTRTSIVDGAGCSGRLAAASIRLEVTRSRLAQLDAMGPGPLAADLELERELLRGLAGPEEEMLKPGSALNVRLQRSTNSGNLFDAMLKAVTERKSDKLDEASVENVKLDARWRKSELERIKADAERDALRDALIGQAQMVVNLVGMMGRCTVMLGEASRALGLAAANNVDDLGATLKSLGAKLGVVAESNDEAFKHLVGVSSAAYAANAAGSIDSFHGHATTLSRPTPGISAPSSLKPKGTRRSSQGLAVGSPARKLHRSSPRKGRASLTGAHAPHSRRVSSSEVKKKSVQWKDEAGQGSLDDGGGNPFQISTIPDVSVIASSPLPDDSGTGLRRPASVAGSESEWEDERTDDSVHASFSGFSSRQDSLSGSTLPLPSASHQRTSRLGSAYLKSRGSTLSSLAEVEGENGTPMRPSPLSDLSLNRMRGSAESSNSSSSSEGPSTLHVPKGRERHAITPAKRAPAMPRVVGSAAKSGRRRSNIGPLRHEKQRRRSSQIPQLSPRASLEGNTSLSVDLGSVSTSGAAKRVIIDGMRSPPKRAKRMSVLGAASKALKPRTVGNSPMADPNLSLGPKPTWR
ncbi:kinesin-domain-containing protein [Punctularia strigosozonata HHB-11173 SS5]|uniref:kinesin-domain-containing protein n=1 Tax=Punctularia strigosozonata (strain HHB-11173) TaxID=741275 RepID=UPI0004417755|nr:kinesin-domain-containing protein [Punctularia strigosozonata HHB-11173 SS5]EIN10851.1 kinesin-domain-containing protein [Punctularia strigosozonata HHB-11173 SS5]